MKKILALTALLLLGFQVQAHAIPILDTLGTATPSTQFSLFGSSGISILPTQFVGPQFSLTQPTRLTEIGGFLNSTGSSPFTVEIHRSTAGAPDPDAVLRSRLLFHDNDPLIVSYESVATHFVLGPGSYFALFAPLDSSGGFILAGASDPFDYRAGLTTLGCLGPSCGPQTVSEGFAALRILGKPVASVPEPSTLLLLGTGLVATRLIMKRKKII